MEFSEQPTRLVQETSGWVIETPHVSPESVRSTIGSALVQISGKEPEWWASGNTVRPYRVAPTPESKVVILALPPAAEAMDKAIAASKLEFWRISRPSIPDLPSGNNSLAINLMSPIVPDGPLAGSSRGARRPDPVWFLPLCRWRASMLVGTHIERTQVPPDPVRALNAKAAAFRVIMDSGEHQQVSHRSTHTPGIFTGNGWTGFLFMSAPEAALAAWWPWLYAASFWGVGRGTPWGQGAFAIAPMQSQFASAS